MKKQQRVFLFYTICIIHTLTIINKLQYIHIYDYMTVQIKWSTERERG